MILTNGGGAGVLAVDDLIQSGGRLAPLSEGAMAALDKVLPANWSRANPVDIIGDAAPKRYADALDALPCRSGGRCPARGQLPDRARLFERSGRASGDRRDQARAEPRAAAADPDQLAWREKRPRGGRRLFREASIPTYELPTDAVKGFLYLWQHTQAQEALMRTPPRETERRMSPRRPRAPSCVRPLPPGASMLTEPEAKAVLSAYGIPTVATRVAASPQEVEAIAEGLLQQAPALAVKILSKDISHKSDIGGVRLGLRSAREAVRAAEQMRKRGTEPKPERASKASPCSPW